MSNGLSSLFQPRSIAVVGASATATKVGGRPIDYLKRSGYSGKIYPINPNYPEILGIRSYPSIHSIDEPIDLAIVALPSSQVEGAVRQIAAAGVDTSVLFSAGFAEIGGEGGRSQDALREIAGQSGLRLLGPNCLGLINVADGMYATFSPVVDAGLAHRGNIAIASQSGAFGGFAYSMARERGLGLSYWVTTGNESDVEIAECIEWLVEDPQTKVILIYLEGCRDGARLMRAFRKAAEAGKPIVAMKVGRSDIGAVAASSHTAALAGSDAVYDAVFKHYGVFRAETISEFFDLGYAFAVGRPLEGRRLGAFTVSGGVGIMFADAADKYGLQIPALSEAAQAEIRRVIPYAGTRNPVDATGQVTNDPKIIDHCVGVMLGEGRYDALVSFMAASGLSVTAGEKLIDIAELALQETVLPVFCTLFKPELRRRLEEKGCLAFEDPAAAIRAIAALAEFGTRQLEPIAPAPDASGSIKMHRHNEAEALAVLAQAGIPVARHEIVKSPEAAADRSTALGYPVVLKILSRDIAHKSEIGGVQLNLRNRLAVKRAYKQCVESAAKLAPDAVVDGALLMEQKSSGIECILGMKRDPVFGPMVAFGLGGIFVETFRDVALRPAPITLEVARAMIRETKAAKILAGTRGKAPTDVECIAHALVALGNLAVTVPAITEIDVNPFLVFERGGVALDAVIELVL